MAANSVLKYTNKLQGSRVLVLGGSTGIGFTVAEAAMEHGANVIISSSNQTKLDAAVARLQNHAKAANLPSVQVSSKTCDLGNTDTMEDNVIQLLETATQGGKLDHVVFTAGDAINVTPLEEATIAEIQRFNVVRGIGSIIVAKHLPKYMNSSTSSSYTLTGGTNSWRPTPKWSLIAGAGSSTEGYARGFAVDLKPIRVNSVQVGAVHTELFKDIPKERLQGVLDVMKKEAITGTVGRPEEVAEAFIYFMKGTFTTGSVLQADGGRLVGDSKDVHMSL